MTTYRNLVRSLVMKWQEEAIMLTRKKILKDLQAENSAEYHVAISAAFEMKHSIPKNPIKKNITKKKHEREKCSIFIACQKHAAAF